MMHIADVTRQAVRHEDIGFGFELRQVVDDTAVVADGFPFFIFDRVYTDHY